MIDLSGEQKYKDLFGVPCTLREMFKREPGWAMNRFQFMEKENEQLKAQLEKAKCCGSCKWWDYLGPYTPFCSYKDDTPPKLAKYTCESWELIE